MSSFEKGQVNTDSSVIDEILARSVAEILPSSDELKKKLLSGKRLRVYIGADATGSDLHLGHATNFLLLEKLRKLGHEVIVLFGDFTATIGDPTDKDAVRKSLTHNDVQKNIAGWKDQIEKILCFEGDNPARISRNSEWFSKFSLSQLLELTSHFTVQQMLERDMFTRRMKEGHPVYLHEFLYPALQGYDSVVLDVDIEVGGTDQTFNMLAGRTLQRKIKNKEKFIISTTLLVDPTTGKKLMSKSEGGYIALSDGADDMYGKVMALPDEVMNQMFVDCTNVPLAEVEKIIKEHPRDAKMRLAREVVALYHSVEDADGAERKFIDTFKERNVPMDVPIFFANKDMPLVDILVGGSMAKSKTEARRLLKDGAVSNMETHEKITDDTLRETVTIRVGKHRFLKIEIE
jgi:tyrosyl-tRNA synthetase